MSASTHSATTLRQWVKEGRHPLARRLRRIVKGAFGFHVPPVPGVHGACYLAWGLGRSTFATLARALWWTPLFRSRLTPGSGRGLYLYGGLPVVMGSLTIAMGERCRVSGCTTLAGRSASAVQPSLIIGDNVDIGWQTTIAVGRRVEIGDGVRIAGRAFLAGYPGHPLDAEARARGAPDTEDQIGDIILEPDVWLATGVTVSAGVRIGRGTIVAAGSVVTHDLPPGVLAGGVPAKVIRQLPKSGGPDVA